MTLKSIVRKKKKYKKKFREQTGVILDNNKEFEDEDDYCGENMGGSSSISIEKKKFT